MFALVQSASNIDTQETENDCCIDSSNTELATVAFYVMKGCIF